jgi:uncharacterized membrane protein
MSTLFQWIHLSAAVVGVGGITFLLYILLPSTRALPLEHRDNLLRAVLKRFRWVSWSVIILLLGSGLYNVRMAWEAPWGTYWYFLTIKIILALSIFLITLSLTLPFDFLARIRARRELWLTIVCAISLVVLLISAFLRRA